MYQYIHQNIIDTISRIEQNFPVHKLTHENVKIWPLIKADFNFQMILNSNKEVEEEQVSQRKNWKQKIGDVISAYKTYKKEKKKFADSLSKCLNNSLPSSAKYIFITFSTYRSKTANNSNFNSQSDTFLSTTKNPQDIFVIEFSFYNAAPSKTYNADLYRDKASVKQKKNKLLHYTLALFNITLGEKTSKIHQEFKKFLHKENIDLNYNISYFQEQINSILLLKNELKELYRKLKPQYVIFPCYFNHEAFASILACNELGIKTIEMQHGVYSQPVYCYYGATPTKGYELLPNYFFSWDEPQANIINEWMKKTDRHKSFVYGINSLSYWQKNRDSFINNHYTNLQSLLASDKIKVIFTISDSIDEKLPQLIKNTENTCIWFIRNHPRASNSSFINKFKKKMQHLNCSNFEIDNSTHAPLYTLLWEMDYHVTMISSVVCESSKINLPSIVICDSGKQLFHDFYNNNPLIMFTTNEEEIQKTISTKRNTQNKINTTQNHTFEDFILNK